MTFSYYLHKILLAEVNLTFFFFFFLNRGSEGKLNDCQITFVNEIFKIEKPGAHPLSLADGKFLSMIFFVCGLSLHMLYMIVILIGQGITFEEM